MSLKAQTTFDTVDRPRLQIQKNVGGTLTLKMFVDGTQVIPTSATITLLRPGGGSCTTPVTDATVQIAGGIGTMTYAMTSGNADLLAGQFGGYAPWIAQWSIVYSGATYKYIQEFDVVLFPVYCVVTQDDLKTMHPDLTDGLYSTESTAQNYIDLAWYAIYQKLLTLGKRPYLIVGQEALRFPTMHYALMLYFQARRKEAGDRWDMLREWHFKEFDKWFSTTTFTYDEDQTGTVVPGEVDRPITQPAFRI